MEKDTKEKIEIECSVCKTKFDIWLSTSNHSEELEKNIIHNFYRYCPVCKIMEDLKKKEEK